MKSRPRVLVAAIFHETHTFLEGVTKWSDFQVMIGQQMLSIAGDSSPLGGALEAGDELGWEICPALAATASPSAIVSDEVYQLYLQRLLMALEMHRQQGPLDAVFLVLHGAMVCESIEDVEGQLLEDLAAHLGPLELPVFGVYDLHANFTQRMAQFADCLVAYRQNPHADARESAVRAVRLLDDCLKSKTRPRMLLSQPSLMWPPTGTGTATEPMASLLEKARHLQLRYPEFLEVNVNAGFSFADTPETGVSFSIATTGDDASAESALQELTQMAVELAEKGNVLERPVDNVLAELPRDQAGLLVVVEPSDNIGGGAPGDCTGLLRAFLRHGFRNTAICINDPEVVGALQKHTTGDQIRIQLGGKGSQLDPGPVELEVVLVSLHAGKFELVDKQSHLASMVGDFFDMGDCAVIRVEGITILVTSNKTPPMDLGQWLHVGLDPSRFSFVGVKAAVAHRKAWDTISVGNVWVGTPGPCSSDLAQLPYRRIRRPIFPLDDCLKPDCLKSD
ncbi:MAG: M81 family metallopeptidase [Planctomycetaceae bacterium]|nr:M81 family metallopeptidase [Planctomycetaceae bacterium]